ncbi:GGDEF domain-containing protein [Pseudoalteromonas luteoviolacea]|uniref:GGDEF domain-containing protein n=1 Tax=Pseudoalteromonas luteoviolacea TaxID=43657 RepID=UPI0011AB736A|nr:GGDEF domain-containing protein [Pseudoalteromonas luteoviolacea]
MTTDQLLEYETAAATSPSTLLSSKEPDESIDEVLWLTLKARAAFFRGDIETAEATFDSAKLKVQAFPLKLSSGYWFLYRAFFSIEQGELDKAKQYIKQARLCFTQNKATDFLIRTHAMEAVISVWREEYSFALKSLQSAQASLTRSENKSDNITRMMVYDSSTAYYSTLKFYVKALGYAHQAYDLAQRSQNLLDGLPIKYNLCLTLLRAQLIEKAQQCYQKMYNVSELHNLPRYEFWALSGLGKIALSNKKFADAVKYLQAARQTQHNAIVNPAHIIVLHNNLAYAFSQLKLFDSALEQIALSKQLLKSYNSALNNRYIRQTLKIEADVYQSKQDLPQTISTLRTYIRLLEESELKTQSKLENNTGASIVLEQPSRALQQVNSIDKGNHSKALKQAQIIIVLLIIALCISIIYFRHSKNNLVHTLNYTDVVTGLYNRRYFIEQFEGISKKSLDYAMALIEITPEKTESSYCSDVDESIIKFAAHQLSMQFRDDGDLVCRVSDQEFVILCQGMKKPILQKRLAILQHLFATHESATSLQISGALICSEEGDFGNIFAELESRLSHVKRTAKGQVVAF